MEIVGIISAVASTIAALASLWIIKIQREKTMAACYVSSLFHSEIGSTISVRIENNGRREIRWKNIESTFGMFTVPDTYDPATGTGTTKEQHGPLAVDQVVAPGREHTVEAVLKHDLGPLEFQVFLRTLPSGAAFVRISRELRALGKLQARLQGWRMAR